MESVCDFSHSNSPILDLSQRTINSTKSNIFVADWTSRTPCIYTDTIEDDAFNQNIEAGSHFNVDHSLTDQYRNLPIGDKSRSDETTNDKSKLDLSSCPTNKASASTSQIVIHDLQPSSNSSSPLPDFIWAKYFSIINERSVSDEFFDHYLTSISSGFEINMKLEYCYDTQRDLYWLTQIQLVSHSLILLHYVGIPEDDTSGDFWAYVYEQRCHPIGWCKDNSKLMLPPPIVTKRAVQQTATSANTATNGTTKEESEGFQTAPPYLFDKNVGLNPVEQLKCGMILEIQDAHRPWTLWFTRIISNHGGRLQLRYITSTSGDESTENSSDIFIFYLDWRVHFVGWASDNASIYSYDTPSCLAASCIDKQAVMDWCVDQSARQFLPSNLFHDQEKIRPHRFTENMKLEVFDSQTQNIYVGTIGRVHNEYYFDVVIDNESQTTFVAHATHPYVLPAHWAAEHRFSLLKGKGARQPEDYWNSIAEKAQANDIAPERCFNLIKLNSTGNNRAEAGMKMEMIYTLNKNDLVFSVTLTHVFDHLMWLKVDNPSLFEEDHLFYHVVPINSLDVFPVGWAKFNGFNLVTPIEYKVDISTYEQNRYDLFSSVTHHPKIPRVYLKEIYQLTLYVNMLCFPGPHLCLSRLSRIPSKFGPGPYRYVLIDMFHHLLSAFSTSTNALRALRRLEHSSSTDSTSNFKTEYIKAAKRSSRLIRPISIPTNPHVIHHYIRHVCTQLEACANFISMRHNEVDCPDKCHILINTFASPFHLKHKRAQPRTVQSRQRRQKSLLCHLKANNPTPPVVEAEAVEATPPTDQPQEIAPNDVASAVASLPGSDRKTRGFRLHIEPRTHTVTRTNKKQKLSSTVNPDLEPADDNTVKSEPSSSVEIPIVRELKSTRLRKNKRSSSPPSLVTMNILSNPCSLSNRTKRKRYSPEILDDNVATCPSSTTPKLEMPQPPLPLVALSTRNPVTWNVNDVCSYLNQSGCSFALKTIKEHEIDGAALLLLDDLPKVQDLLEFKLGPAVKFCHVVEQLRTQVIDTFHSSPSLKASRLSASNTS